MANYLLSQPESGMGYQTVEATTFADRTRRGVALNAELLVFDDEDRTPLRTKTFRTLVEAAPSWVTEIRSISLVPRSLSVNVQESVSVSDSVKAEIKPKAKPAKDAPEEKTKEGEVFKRFVAYADDRRLRADDSWSPGTYATTEADAKNVKTGTEAVARYALPNPAPASYVFTGKPKKDTVIQRGTVAPAYGQPGGGVEVYFKDTTQPNTVTGPDKIPDA
jgi:hypothetical protein